MISNDKTHKETAYKLENIIEKVEEGGYGEEIEETGGGGVAADVGELKEDDEVYQPGKEEEEPAEEYEEYAEEDDEKEYVNEASEIGASVRIM